MRTRHTCPRCGYVDIDRGLAITKKMIREVEIDNRIDCSYVLSRIKEQSEMAHDKDWKFYRVFTPNQAAYVKACIKHNKLGIMDDWVKNLDWEKGVKIKND